MQVSNCHLNEPGSQHSSSIRVFVWSPLQRNSPFYTVPASWRLIDPQRLSRSRILIHDFVLSDSCWRLDRGGPRSHLDHHATFSLSLAAFQKMVLVLRLQSQNVSSWNQAYVPISDEMSVFFQLLVLSRVSNASHVAPQAPQRRRSGHCNPIPETRSYAAIYELVTRLC